MLYYAASRAMRPNKDKDKKKGRKTMNGKVKINVGDYVFNKDDVAKGLSTILYCVEDATERDVKRYNDKTGHWEVCGTEVSISAYLLETHQGYSFSIRPNDKKWAVLPAETMKVLCA